jgi:hypothetical protein
VLNGLRLGLQLDGDGKAEKATVYVAVFWFDHLPGQKAVNAPESR